MLPRAREGIWPGHKRQERSVGSTNSSSHIRTSTPLRPCVACLTSLKEPVSNRAQEDARLLRLIRASFVASHGIYGAPRVFLDLREAGETCSKHRVARLMRINGIRAAYGYGARRHSAAKPSALIPNSLQRNFTVSKPNAAWVTDITYIRTWQGWLYLAVVMDLFSRKIIGWSTKPTMTRELALDAVLDGRASSSSQTYSNSLGPRFAVRE